MSFAKQNPILTILILVALSALPAAAQDPTTPTTGPTTQATEATYQTMDKDRLKFVMPAGWRRIAASKDELSVKYVTDDGDGVILFINSPQSAPPGPSIRGKMAQEVVKGLNAGIDKQNIEITLRPTQEKDDRFYLR